jgi:hypothetical protein
MLTDTADRTVFLGVDEFPHAASKHVKSQGTRSRAVVSTPPVATPLTMTRRVPRTLERLVAPVGVSAFRSSYHGRRALHLTGTPDRYAGLFDMDRFCAILNASPGVPRTLYSAKGGRAAPLADASAVIARYRDGDTLILEELHRYDPRVGELVASLTADLNERVKAGLYLSPPDFPAFNIHYDTYDGYVLQLAGKKRWRVCDPTVPHPMFNQKQHVLVPGDVTESHDVVLSAGDFLYVPRGHWHAVVATEEPSLHITLFVYPNTGVDFLAWLSDELREDPAWRRSLPLLFDNEWPQDGTQPAAIGAHAEQLAASLAGYLRDPALFSRYHRFKMAQDRAVAPYAVLTDTQLPPGDDETLCRPAYQRAAVTRLGDTIELAVWGRIYRFAAAAEALISFIVAADTFTLRALFHHAGGLSETAVTEVVRELLLAGVIARDPRATHQND